LDVIQTIILCDITTLKERPRYLGLMSLATATGGVTGPILGGAFAELVDWRWLGWINVLVVGITGVLAFFFLHLRPIDAESKTKLIDAESKTKLLRLDWIGFLLFTIAATAVVLPLSWAGALFAWSSWQTIVPLVIGFLVLIPFALAERKAVEPMIPYRIFDNTTTIASTIMGFIYGLLLNPILLYLPLFFQAIFLQAPLQGAVSALPL
jgi:MFS family permease